MFMIQQFTFTSLFGLEKFFVVIFVSLAVVRRLLFYKSAIATLAQSVLTLLESVNSEFPVTEVFLSNIHFHDSFRVR